MPPIAITWHFGGYYYCRGNNYFQNLNGLSSKLPSFFLKSHDYYFIQETLQNDKYLGKRPGWFDTKAAPDLTDLSRLFTLPCDNQGELSTSN